MAAIAHVAVASSGDMEVALHLVELETAKYTAAIRLASRPRGSGPLCALLAKGDDIVNVLLTKALFCSFSVEPSGARIDTAMFIMVELVHASSVRPGLPVCRVLLEALSRQDAVT